MLGRWTKISNIHIRYIVGGNIEINEIGRNSLTYLTVAKWKLRFVYCRSMELGIPHKSFTLKLGFYYQQVGIFAN